MTAERIDTKFRQEQIALVAMDLVASQGIKSLTVTRVAEKIGVVPSALYKHFKNKGQIVEVIISMIEEQMFNLLRSAKMSSGGPLEFFKKLYFAEVGLIIQFAAAPIVFFSDDVMGGSTSRRARMKNIGKKIFGEIEGMIKKGQDSGCFRKDLPAKNLALFYFGIVAQIAMPNQLLKGDLDLMNHSEIAWCSFVDLMRPR